MNVSRENLYSYISTMFSGVTSNIYTKMPQTLTSSMATNGFILLSLENMIDFSEMSLNTYVQVRVNVEYYTPSMNTATANRIMDNTKFDGAQTAIDAIIDAESKKVNQTYTISKDGLLSADDFYTNGANTFFIYITSFIVTITD